MSVPHDQMSAARRQQEAARRREELPLLLGRGVSPAVTRHAITWGDLQGRLRLARTDNVPYEDYINASRDEKLRIKSHAGYCIPSDIEGGMRGDEFVRSRWAVWVDVEGGNQPIDVVLSALQPLGVEVFWHSTRSHHPDIDRRYRLWVPVLENLDGYQFSRLAGLVCDTLEHAGVRIDRRASTVYSQPAFLPIVGPGQTLEHGLVEGHFLSLLDLGTTGVAVEDPGVSAFERATDAHHARHTTGDRQPEGPLFEAFAMQGDVIGRVSPGTWKVRCPNHDQHTDPTDDAAYYYEPNYGGHSGEGFRCFHAHCQHITPLSLKVKFNVQDMETENAKAKSRAEALTPGIITIKSPLEIRPRAWIVPDTLLKGYISIVHAPGGSAKSTWALLQCLSVAVGRDLTGKGLARSGPGAVEEGVGKKVWIINNEDDEEEMIRRLFALAKHHDLDWSHVTRNVRITSGYQERLTLATLTEQGSVVPTQWAKSIAREIKAHGIEVLCVDPIVSTHTANENDNREMDAVMGVFRRLADVTDVALLLVAHDRKGGPGGGGAGPDGDTDKMRGASAVRDAARITMTMSRPSRKEVENLGLDWEEVGRFLVQLADGKKNFSPPSPNAEWFRLVSVPLGQGDFVAAMERFDVVAAAAAAKGAEEERQRKFERTIGQTTIDVVLREGKAAPAVANGVVSPLAGGLHMNATTAGRLILERIGEQTGIGDVRTLSKRLREQLSGRVWEDFTGTRRYRLDYVETTRGQGQIVGNLLVTDEGPVELEEEGEIDDVVVKAGAGGRGAGGSEAARDVEEVPGLSEFFY